MVKKKISKKQKPFSKSAVSKLVVNKTILLNKKLVVQTLVDALLNDDMDSFRDILISHLRAHSKTELAKKTGVGRRTLYDLMSSENFDPRISTISSLLSKLAA